MYGATAGNIYVYDLIDGSCVHGDYLTQLGDQIYFHYALTVLYCGLPSALLFVFNIIILYKLKTNASTMKKSSRQSAITKVLLLVSWAFLFFTACSAIPIYLVLFYLNPMLDPNTPDDIEHEISNNILLAVELPAVGNVAFNCVFYVLGSKIFRDEFVAMFRKRFCCRKVHPNNGAAASQTQTQPKKN
ncbi:uncharacterized protein LOC134855619 [Symsagittifera roscoffensis]|uniref:uncharacterized protein LOC134855619 n=1 Tax=Symsagittifera roscoffensis TaxID=84072 RepID=UPI00307B4C7B